MALTQYTQSTDVILNLGTDPEDRPDMDDPEFKAKFDENATNIVTYLNDTHLPEVQTALDAKSNNLVGFVAVTASKIFALTDADKVQLCNHASVAINLTIPPNADVAFPVGTVLAAQQIGAAQTAFVAGSGVTINPSTKLKINAQNDLVGAIQTSANVWYLIGPTKA